MENSVASREIDSSFLALLVCPATRQSLRQATVEELVKLGVNAACVREDGRVAYPIRKGIPVLIADAAIQLD